jgi:hypothetical protein
MARVLVVLIASFVAASCALVRSDVTVSHALPAGDTAKTVVIMPYTDDLKAAPEFGSYVAKLAAHLEARGYDVVEPSGGRAPDYIAFFMYGIDGGTPVNQLQSVPVPRTGSIISYGLRAPFSHATRRVYSRRVILEILDRARFRPNEPASFIDARVYSASVTSEGACSTMEPVIDPMLTALFAEFPGESGAFRTVELRADTACGPSRRG